MSLHDSERVPEAESPTSRTEEQEVASGRTASTPVAVLGSIVFLVACAVVLVLALVVLAIYLA
jgi:hypothetical protein